VTKEAVKRVLPRLLLRLRLGCTGPDARMRVQSAWRVAASLADPQTSGGLAVVPRR
jgi:hypothetical protein